MANIKIVIQNAKNAYLYVKKSNFDGAIIADNTDGSTELNIDLISLQNQMGNWGEVHFYFTHKNPNERLTEQPYLVVEYDGLQLNMPGDEYTGTDNYQWECYFQFTTQSGIKKVYAFAYGVYGDLIETASITNIIADCRAGSESTAIDYKVTKIYSVDENILGLMKQERYIVKDYTDVFYEVDDLGKFILGIYHFPFDVKLETQSAIILGNLVTQINADTVLQRTYTFTTIFNLNGYYNDTRDLQTKIKLSLPYYGLIDIDSVYINTEIRIDYLVDISKNNAIINIYSNDKLIDTYNCVVGYSVAYILNNNDSLTKTLDTKQLFSNDFYYELERPLQANNRVQTLKKDLIGNFTGYVKTNDFINISANATQHELNEIKNLLMNGVFI